MKITKTGCCRSNVGVAAMGIPAIAPRLMVICQYFDDDAHSIIRRMMPMIWRGGSSNCIGNQKK